MSLMLVVLNNVEERPPVVLHVGFRSFATLVCVVIGGLGAGSPRRQRSEP